MELSDVPLPIGGWDEGLVVKEGWGMMGGGGFKAHPSAIFNSPSMIDSKVECYDRFEGYETDPVHAFLSVM